MASRTVVNIMAPAVNTSFNLEQEGLCRAFQQGPACDICIGTLCHKEHQYEVYPDIDTVQMSEKGSLADVIEGSLAHKIGRVQRYGIALTLASSHLQLYKSAWLSQTWTCEDILFPITSDLAGRVVLHGPPYILTGFTNPSSSSNSQPQKDRVFSTLGIVLLELCFGVRLEAHRLWQNSIYTIDRVDPMLRQAVACEWLEEVEYEAGVDYATAVKRALKRAPALIKDDTWRADFAKNVVQPLQRCFESMKPK